MKRLQNIDVTRKQVLLRTDFDVPLQNQKIIDDSRIKAAIPTINYLLKNKVKTITIICHLGRPDGKIVESLSVSPVREYLQKLLPQNNPVKVEENLRFHKGEKENDLEFAKRLAHNQDLFINDAFAVSHRQHASIVSLPQLLPSAIGIHFTEEIKALDKVLHNPERPLVFILGGAKLETKLPLIKKLTTKADEILIGGKLAVEIENHNFTKSINLSVAELEKSKKDITLKSANDFSEIILKAKTVVWNGPMGIYENSEFSQGTEIIAQAINQSNGYSVIGGGDTEAAATKFQAEENIDHISMGGGAMLQYLAEGTLPGLEALKGEKND